jgi:small conductance mechanosensitive channel
MHAPIPIDFSNAWKSGERILNTAIGLLPNIVIALVIFVAFLIFGAFLRSMVRSISLRREGRQNLSILLGQLTHTLIVILGFLIALSVVAPSFQAADLIKMLGIGSVAIGFAFQNILQNFLAGVLLLMQEPFTIGDWISVTGIEGKVEDIQTRATVIATKDGNRVVIPNATLFTNPVAVGEPKKHEAPAPASVAPPAPADPKTRVQSAG